jgi:hypothetical protein
VRKEKSEGVAKWKWQPLRNKVWEAEGVIKDYDDE